MRVQLLRKTGSEVLAASSRLLRHAELSGLNLMEFWRCVVTTGIAPFDDDVVNKALKQWSEFAYGPPVKNRPTEDYERIVLRPTEMDIGVAEMILKRSLGRAYAAFESLGEDEQPVINDLESALVSLEIIRRKGFVTVIDGGFVSTPLIHLAGPARTGSGSGRSSNRSTIGLRGVLRSPSGGRPLGRR